MVTALFVSLVNRIGIIIILSVVITKIKLFRTWITSERVGFRDRLLTGIVFGVIGIIGTYAGIPVGGAVVNARVIGPAVGGLLGGPVVGIIAGAIAGIHRIYYDIYGFTTVACALATFLEGVVAGYLSRQFYHAESKWVFGFNMGVISELIHMALVLLLSHPFSEAWALVRLITFPMVLTNAIGISIFMAMVETIYRDQETIAAFQAQRTLEIANNTLSHLKKGLSPETAERTAEIIYKKTDFKAVSLTNTKVTLTHLGSGSDHHRVGDPIMEKAVARTLETGDHQVAQIQDDIACQHKKCRLRSAVVVPLKDDERIVGTLKLYKDHENAISKIDVELALGLSSLFSTQLQLARLDEQEKLLNRAELRALQSQINPHFLFNAINTIVSFVRMRPDRARELLIHLAEYFRNNLLDIHEDVEFFEEIENVRNYVEIEMARFGDKLEVIYDLDDQIKCIVPPLIIQPLVENAIKHGILEKEGPGRVSIVARVADEMLSVQVIDDGVGFDAEAIRRRLVDGPQKTHAIGLHNVHQRLKNKYGEQNGLIIESQEGFGSTVSFRVPRKGIST